MNTVLRRSLAALVVAGGLLFTAYAGGASLDLGACGWGLKTDPNVVNVLWPDQAAVYWTMSYVGLPGTKLVIRGQYPHSRYMSYIVYDAAFRPLDGLADVEIAPKSPSAINPFAAGADRNTADRDYEVTIRFEEKPASPSPNTIYTGRGQPVGSLSPPNPSGFIIYRIYLPDDPLDEQGGVGVPHVSLAADGVEGSEQSLDQDDACNQLKKLPDLGVNEVIREGEFPREARALLPPWPGHATPGWRPFRAFNSSLAALALDNDLLAPVGGPAVASMVPPIGSGGFASNIHNNYLTSVGTLRYGDVLVVRGRAPTFPKTGPDVAIMPAGQVRYWSVCSNDTGPTRFVGCLFDQDLVVGSDGQFTVVVSQPSDRPANTIGPNAVASWLPWGAQPSQLVIYRQMLADDATFPQSLARGLRDGLTDAELPAFMGDYFPRAKYCSKTEFEEGSSCGLP